MDKMREEFERWAVEKSMLLDLDVVSGQVVDWYRCDTTDAAWELWKSSRAALVVELPSEEVQQFTDDADYMNGYESGYLSALDSIKESLDKAGIKYE